MMSCLFRVTMRHHSLPLPFPSLPIPSPGARSCGGTVAIPMQQRPRQQQPRAVCDTAGVWRITTATTTTTGRRWSVAVVAAVPCGAAQQVVRTQAWRRVAPLSSPSPSQRYPTFDRAERERGGYERNANLRYLYLCCGCSFLLWWWWRGRCSVVQCRAVQCSVE